MAIKPIMRLKREEFKTNKEYLKYMNSPGRLGEDAMENPQIRKMFEDWAKLVYALHKLEEKI